MQDAKGKMQLFNNKITLCIRQFDPSHLGPGFQRLPRRAPKIRLRSDALSVLIFR